MFNTGIIHNNLNLETIQMLFNNKWNKQNTLYLHNGIVHSNERINEIKIKTTR